MTLSSASDAFEQVEGPRLLAQRLVTPVQLDVGLLELTDGGHELLLARVRAMIGAPGAFLGLLEILLEVKPFSGRLLTGDRHLLA